MKRNRCMGCRGEALPGDDWCGRCQFGDPDGPLDLHSTLIIAALLFVIVLAAIVWIFA